jgi:inosine-uridine nucleoside N-ribohydrolase
VNNTINGEGIQGHYDEAYRVISLFNLQDKMPLKKGAIGTFSQILPSIEEPNFDGSEAVNFIIDEAKKVDNGKLVLIPIGKLTNIALALKKAPEIKNKVRVVWLGSNYPESGEYNLENDTSAVNPVIESGVEFEMVTVRWGAQTGTAAVTVTREEISNHVAGRGPKAKTPVIGRHGGQFFCFGDYSVNLFENATMGHGHERALFDMAAIAIVKNPSWAEKHWISSPRLINGNWVTIDENQSEFSYWENFNRDSIIADFFSLMDNYPKP